MKKKIYTLIYSAVVFGVVIGVALVIKIKRAHDNPFAPKRATITQVEDDYTAEQKQLLKELRETKAYIEKSKIEINETLNALRACAVQKGLDPNVQTTWLQNGCYGGSKNYNVVVGNGTGTPILWGFRSDGLVTWKNP